MKFSLRLNNDLPVRDYVRLAQLAEEAGFDQFWVSNDLFLRSAPVILTAVALATRRIEIGTCILNPYTIHPAEIAMLAATLDRGIKGPVQPGAVVGAGEFLAWVGIEAARPRPPWSRRSMPSGGCSLGAGRAAEATFCSGPAKPCSASRRCAASRFTSGR